MSILIIDDVRDDLNALQSMLVGAQRWNIVVARSTEEALRTLESREVEMVLADIMTPATGGLEIRRQIKARSDLSHTPVVIIMANSERAYLTQAYESGACDYLMKPLDAAEVVARVGAVLWSKEEVDRRIARESELMATTRHLQAANPQLLRLSVVDAVTGIANRRSFDQTLDRIWRSCSGHQWEMALVMIDIDCFKGYNDSLGHPAGDACLRQVARGLTGTDRCPETSRRLSGAIRRRGVRRHSAANRSGRCRGGGGAVAPFDRSAGYRPPGIAASQSCDHQPGRGLDSPHARGGPLQPKPDFHGE